MRAKKPTHPKAEAPAALPDEALNAAAGGGGKDHKDWIDVVSVSSPVHRSSSDADDRPTEEVAFYYNRI